MNIVKKVCFKCNKEKPLSDYYKHKQMADGHLNKCITCTRSDVKKRADEIYKDPEMLEKERKRSREKYHRLNYKEKQNKWNKDKPWKKSAVYKNLNRDFNIPKGLEIHHWNYNDDYLKNFFVMDRREHRKLHSKIEFNLKTRIYTSKLNGEVLDTREKHLNLINKLGFKTYEI